MSVLHIFDLSLICGQAGLVMSLFVLTEAQTPALVLPSGLCGVGHIHLMHQRLKATEGKLLLRPGLRPKPDGPTHFWNRDVFTEGLREGEGMSQLCGARAAGRPSGLLLLSTFWVASPINCFANCMALALLCQLICHGCPFGLVLPPSHKKIRFSFYIVWVKDVMGPVMAWHTKKNGQIGLGLVAFACR